MKKLLFLTAIATVLSLSRLPSEAAEAPLKVFTSGGPAQVERKVFDVFARQIGRPVEITVSNLKEIQDKIQAGDIPDVVIMPKPALASLAKKGAVLDQTDLARVGIGVIVNSNAPAPDISTVNAFLASLLAAKSIVYPGPDGGGYTGAHIHRFLETMGLTDQLDPKTTHLFAIKGGVQSVSEGRIELGLFNISETAGAPNIRMVGPLPSSLQHYILFSGAVFAKSGAPEAARTLLQNLASAAAQKLWWDGGFEPTAGVDETPVGTVH